MMTVRQVIRELEWLRPAVGEARVIGFCGVALEWVDPEDRSQGQHVILIETPPNETDIRLSELARELEMLVRDYPVSRMASVAKVFTKTVSLMPVVLLKASEAASLGETAVDHPGPPWSAGTVA